MVVDERISAGRAASRGCGRREHASVISIGSICLRRAATLWRYGRPDVQVDMEALFPTERWRSF